MRAILVECLLRCSCEVDGECSCEGDDGCDFEDCLGVEDHSEGSGGYGS